MRADLTADTIEEILASENHWLLHAPALNRRLPHPIRMRLGMLERFGQQILEDDRPRQFSAKLAHKDISNALRMAPDLPITAMVSECLRHAVADGHGEENSTRLTRLTRLTRYRPGVRPIP
ncbi:hypothetical protein [Plantactinospora sp. KBS50]|uniref:hypothetical protein n=1 Tax=Plantactinospora sp. KBS50 TaxID=2024580 RepID=UPI0012FDB298|nr:hypothetical protein [Plantactinospora sp. KBS50]